MDIIFWLIAAFTQYVPGPILVPGWDVTLSKPAPQRPERDLMTITRPVRVVTTYK